jgi:hypothetical protein
MPKSDLAAKYGASKNLRQLINAAIRAELPGGAAALDALYTARTAAAESAIGEDCLTSVRQIIDAMADEIRRRYGLAQD